MEKLLTKEEVATILGINRRTIEAWVRLRQIPFTRVGAKAVRFSDAQIRAWLKSRENVPVVYQKTE